MTHHGDVSWAASSCMVTRVRALTLAAALLVLAGWQARTASQGAAPIPTPRQAFGASIGDDYFLATYTQLEQYWKAIDRASDRVALADIGRTEEGRTQWMAIVSAPENIAALDRYKS